MLSSQKFEKGKKENIIFRYCQNLTNFKKKKETYIILKIFIKTNVKCEVSKKLLFADKIYRSRKQ